MLIVSSGRGPPHDPMMASRSDKPGRAQRTSLFARIVALNCDSRTSGGPIRWLFDMASGLFGAEREAGGLPIGGGDQVFRHQQQRRQDQRIDDRDRDDTDGEAAIAVVK